MPILNQLISSTTNQYHSLLSAGADSSVAIWDLEAASDEVGSDKVLTPLGQVKRTADAEALGITHVSFYPFDSLAFLTSGYDRTVKLFSSETLATSASFDLDSVVYSFAVSNVASHLLVACASQHPAVRLVDLKSGSSTHSLAGHSGSVLATAWHPRNENILASGGSDGAVRLWDVRRSASSLGVLDMDDAVGIAGYDGKGTGARRRERGRAHTGAANGLAWSEDGQYLTTVGHDERMRVWNMVNGANTLANFGPGLRNTTKTSLYPILAPSHLSAPGQEVIFYPNQREITGYDIHSGTALKRLRIPGPQGTPAEGGGRNLKPRTASLAWRPYDVELYSAHGDGTIRCWRPRTAEDAAAEQEEKEDGEVVDEAERKRKRDELDQIVRDLTKRPLTFS